MRITVPQRIAALGFEQNTDRGNLLAWTAGARVREAWEREYKEPPPKSMRTKTAGTGSHFFATYPPEWAERIDTIVREVAEELGAGDQRQIGLFQ